MQEIMGLEDCWEGWKYDIRGHLKGYRGGHLVTTTPQ